MPPIPPPRPNPPAGKTTNANLDDVASKLDEAADKLADAATAYKPVVESNQAAFERLMEAQARWTEAAARQNPPPAQVPAPAPTQTHLARVQEFVNQTGQPYTVGTRLVIPERPPAPVPTRPPAQPTRAIPARPAQVIPSPPPPPGPSSLPPPLPLPPPSPVPPLPPWQSMYGQARAELRKPAVQAEIRERARAGVFEHAQDVDIGGRRQLIENQTLNSPERRALAAAQARLGVIQQTGGTVQAAQLARARAQYAESPEGQGQLQLQAAAQKQIQEAQERQRRADNIAEYGRLGAALREAGRRVAAFGGTLAQVGGAALAGAGTTWNVATEWGSQANPQAGGTLRGSWRLLQTNVGQSYVPEMDAMSRQLQQSAAAFGRLQHENPRAARGVAWGGAGALGTAAAGAGIGFAIGNLPGALIGGAIGAVVGGVGGGAYGAASSPERGARPQLQSFEGLPAGPTFASGEQVMYSAQQMGLNTSPLEAETFRLQLQNMTGLLERIATNSDQLPNMNPAWR